MSPIAFAAGVGVGVGGRARKITVNERVEQILQGSLQIEDENARNADRSPSREGLDARNHQISSLYSASTEDAFVRARVRAAQSVPKPQSSPTPAAAATSNATNVTASPIKPVRCLSLYMLEQQRLEDEQRSRLRDVQDEHTEPSPVHAKPWYKGYSSGHKVPQCSLDAKVRRYGAYGAAKMIASDTVAGTVPQFRLHASQSLDAIAFHNAPSPWSPVLRGSPTLWPEDANYATGCKLEAHAMMRCPSPDFRFPTHSVGVVESDAHFARTKAVHAGEARALEQALEEEKALRKKEVERNRKRLETWKNRLHFEPLSSKMDHPFVKVNARRGKQLTILHTPEYSPASKYSEQVQKLTEQRYALRWHNMAVLLGVMRRTPCRRPVLQDVEKLFTRAYELAVRNASPYELSRQQYWEILQREYPDVEPRHGNRLFSSYDASMEDRLDIRVFFGTIRALRVQQGTPIEILCLSFQDFDATKRGVVASPAHFLAALSLCCGSEGEAEQMEALGSALWETMTSDLRDYHQLRPSHQHLRQHHRRVDDGFTGGGDQRRDILSSTNSLSPSNTEREAFESLGSETEGFSIAFVRRALQSDKCVLAFYSELLLRRREECFKLPIPPSR
ncbi:hypothetical protein PybrP1_000204 [[Pythium] brassicae (nom. inval.)]|nr:hypothetical protein PybrP1_000204 [[Pythium] brassicae (nom. inval.)]